MTHEEMKALDHARGEEAFRLAEIALPDGDLVEVRAKAYFIYRELVVSNWQPPPPVSPRVLAAREWPHNGSRFEAAKVAQEEAFLAGVAWAEKKAAVLRAVIRKTAEMVSTSAAVTSELIAADDTYHKAMGTEQ